MEQDNSWNLPKDYLEFADNVLPFTPEESLGTYYSEWTIDHWSTLENRVNGPSFKTDTTGWNVLLFPRGNNQNQQISLYLENEACKKKTAPNDICAQFVLCIVDPSNPTRIFYKESQHRFNEYEADWGFTQYMDIQEIQNFIVDDTVKLIAIVRLIRDPTGVLWHKFINYDSKKMTGHVGLLNQGATCYMNSLFQSLFFTNLYRKAVFQIPTENDEPTNSMALALQRIFYHLQFSDRAVSTTELTQSFGWDSIDSFMQHDIQEFNRLLQDNIEKKMQGTPAENMIEKLFMGSTISYIKCIDYPYESKRTENYYDIQLNVKGCKDLRESFKDYVQEEVLEGDNKYMVEGVGLQDAKKGVIFENFPPVLHLQLKRFEYDMMRDTMVKINDRYEFPPEIDLRPYLDEKVAQTSESFNYILHGVLVHTGDLGGGHYFAFVRPTKEDQWLKFDDDRVTPATLTEVLEDNYGGIALHPQPNTKNVNRVTNAYMLVYIRESLQEQVTSQVTQNDIPHHLVTRIQQEELYREEMERREAEKHLYMRAYITDDSSFLMNTGGEFVVQSNQIADPPPYVQVRQVLRTQSLKEFLREYPNQNAWYLTTRVNGTVRPGARFTEQDLELSLEQICTHVSKYPLLRLYMEKVPSYNVQDTKLVFIKLFDPVAQSLSGVGKLYVTKDSLVSSIEQDINAMVGFEPSTKLDIYEEETMRIVELIDKNTTFNDIGINDGDILIVQKSQTDEEIQILCQNGSCSDVKEYMDYLVQRVEIMFCGPDKEMFPLELRRDMLYEQVTRIVGEYTGLDSEYLQLLAPTVHGELQGIMPMANLSLQDILQFIPKQNNDGWCLYYNVLPIRLTELKFKKVMKLCICYPTLSQVSYETIFVPRNDTLADLVRYIEPRNQQKRFFTTENHLLKTEFMPNQVVEFIQNQEPIFVEMIPEEEESKGQDDFYIQAFHYHKELTQTHSIPFKLLVIKDEPWVETKERIRNRIGLSEVDFNKISFNIVSKFITIIKEDNFKLSEHVLRPQDVLGLNHPNPTEITTTERKLFIK